MENIPSLSCEEFTAQTASKAAVPGGGSVAALVGSLGSALAGMVCNLTAGKKKYAQYEGDITRILSDAEQLQNELMNQIDRDAGNFLPLSKCYGLPSGTDEEKQVKHDKMQAALKNAVTAPADIVRLSYRAILLQEELAEKGSKIVVSDVGCGALCLKSSLQMGWLNVRINLRSMDDAAFVKSLSDELEPLVRDGAERAERVYADVLAQLG